MKKALNKSVAIILCVIMMLGIAPLNGFVGLKFPKLHLPDLGSIFETKASAATSGTCGDDMTWVYDETTLTLTITGTGDMYDYLRRNYDGIYMTTAPWKPYYNTMKNVVIESGATSISDHAFDGCTGITSITIPNTVTNIGEYAFAKCKGLTSIAIPNSVINIGEYIFSYSGLESVTIGTSVTSLSKDAFRDCTELTSITIPDGVTSIGECAFSGCTGLTDVTIGNGVTSIGEHAFDGCTGLTTITIPGSVKSIYSYAFYGCTDLTSVTIGNGVKSIEQQAFDSCSGLTSITIPGSVTSIAGYAFSGCTGLKTAGPIGGGYNCEFGWTDSIPAHAFHGCSELKSINVPTGITKIGAAAFYESGLTGVKIPESVNKIGSGAFAFCYALKAIEYNAANCTLEPYYSYIDNPFFFCFTESIVVGKNVVSVPAYMFGGTITMDYHKLGVTMLNHNTSIDSACFTARCDDFGEPDEFINGADQSFLGDSGYLREKYGIDSSNYQKITYAEANIIKDNHTFDDGVVIKEATCKDDGEIKYTCTECGYTYTETIPKTDDHDWQKFTITADCNQDGGDLYVCRRCGHSKLENAVPALGHDYVAKATPATCEAGGYTTHTCSRCGVSYTDSETPALSHNYEPFEVRTSCIQDGCTISICSHCGRSTKSDITPATGHTFGNWTVIRSAKENEEGLEQRRCTKCGYTEDRLIPMLERTTYFATFVADGRTVATVEFLKGATSIEEPAVPHKDRYYGKWSEYTLTDSDITINAEYSLINLDDLSGIESGKTATYNSATGEATINIFAASEGKTVVSTTSEKVPLDIILVVDQSGSMADRLGGTKTKQQALKTASTDFVNSVYADAKANGVDHRIAIVGFGMGSQSAQGYSAYQNTEILTTGGNPIQYNNATAQNYANALVKVNNGGNLNATITTAINNIDAKGATAADYGLSMANSIFANTDGEGRQRIVVFMTDGAPTYKSDFSKDVANAAILQANQLKNTYGATVYSVGVMSSAEAADRNIDTFMNYVSSNYADAENIGKTYTKQNDSFCIPVNNTNALSGVFTEIVTENITRTTDFDNLTVIDTISKYFTLTEKQERELRIAAIETYGVKNSDITVTCNDDGTTTVILKNLHPVDDGTKFSVNLIFKVSADEDALKAGTYSTNTEDAGLIIGDGENYECVFDAPTVNIPADRTLSVFKINGEVYALLNADSANIPETDFIGDYEFTGWNPDAGTEIAEGVTEYNAVYVSKQDYVLIWNTDEGTQRLTVTPGEIIDEPSPAPDNAGNTFRRWNGEVPVTMPAGNLEFTAVYGDHEHNYEAEIITPVTCLADGSTKYTCSICRHTYTETVVCPGEHKWIAVTGSANTETGYEEFECEVCGEHCERTLEYTVTGTDESGSGVYNSITTELNYVNANGNNTQPEGNVNIVVPVSDYFDGAEDVDVYRVDGDGNRTQCESDYGYGILSFFTNHFSTYEFVATYTEPCEHKDENNDGSCDICGDPMTYTKDIVVDGNKIGEVTFTYGDTELTGLPEVPAKPGYTGEWDYTINGSELDIHPKYTLITYYATFMADGRQVAKIPFTVESASITAPAVPAKDGYTGKWSEYTLAASNITVNAIYTKIDTPTPSDEYKLPASFKEQTAAYNTIVTVSVTLKNVPSGAKVYIDGKEAAVNGNTYSAEIGQASSTKNVKIEVRQGTKVLDSSTLTVKIDTGFFSKLISFFSNFLFNLFSWKKVTVNF